MEYKCICGKEFKNASALAGHKANCQLSKEEKQNQLKILKIEEENYNCICNCGRKFKTLKSLNSHTRFCDQYIKKDKRSKYFNQDTSTYICECGYETENYQSLNCHFTHCLEHRQMNNKDCSDEYWNKRNHIGKMQGWDNFSEEKLQEIRERTRRTYSENQKNGITPNIWLGRKETPEHRMHIRKGYLKALQDRYEINGKTFRCMYSKTACEYINKLNEEKHWNLQHAENGGEFEIDGYYLDGYDKELNIAFEYDEKRHYTDVNNNILKERDIERQNYIIKKLNCEFWRYNEKKKLLYKVN